MIFAGILIDSLVGKTYTISVPFDNIPSEKSNEELYSFTLSVLRSAQSIKMLEPMEDKYFGISKLRRLLHPLNA